MKIRNVWIAVLCFVLVSSMLVKGDCGNTIITGVIETIVDSEITLVDGTTVDATDAVITVMEGEPGDKEKVIKNLEYLAKGMTVKVSGHDDEEIGVFVAEKINVMFGGAIVEE